MAFQASAPPLPDYQPLSGSEMSKPSSSQAGEQRHQSSLHSFITPAPPDPLSGFPADPHPHHHHHRQHPGYGFRRDPHPHQSGYGAHPHFTEQANPQLAPYPPPPNTVVFGFPVRPPSSPPHWNTGLCGCCSDPTVCCLGCCCPCILFGKIAEDLDEGATPCVSACTIWYLLQQFTLCGWIYSHGYRDKLRSRYGLTRHPCHDCMVHFCCWHCAFCQEYREIQIRKLKDDAAWMGRHAPMAPPSQQVMRG